MKKLRIEKHRGDVVFAMEISLRPGNEPGQLVEDLENLTIEGVFVRSDTFDRALRMVDSPAGSWSVMEVE